jgi:periplasmic protein TonB
LQSRSKNNNFGCLDHPWIVSSLLHGVLVAAVFVVLFVSQYKRVNELDIEIYESPVPAQQPIELVAPKVKQEEPRRHEVFGINPKAVVSDQGETVKAGNTVAKAPDQEQLKPGDSESLPIPSEDYLVTNMPTLISEVRIPYPQESKKKGIQGAVVMDLLIDVTGKVREATLVEGPNKELSAAALSAAKGFQFTAAMIQNKPVAVRIRYVYRFVLER